MKKIFYLIILLFCFALLLTSGLVIFNSYSNKIVSYLSVDINPSFMLGLDRNNIIKEVECLNNDADKLLDNNSIIDSNISDGLELIVDLAIEEEYVNDEDMILLSVYCDNDKYRKNLEKKVNDIVDSGLNSKDIGTLITDEELTLEDAQKANEYGVSEAKILFVKKALEDNPDLKFENLIYLPSREIAKYIDEYEELISNGSQGNKYGQSNGNGMQYGK